MVIAHLSIHSPPTQPICSECTIQFGLNPGLSCTYYSSVASSVLALANDSLLFDFNLPEHLKGRFGAVCQIILKLVTTFPSREKRSFKPLYTLHICHNHHNRWLCKKLQSSVKFSNGYVKENVQFYKKCVILHKFQSV